MRVLRPYTVDTSNGTGGDADMSSTLAKIAEHASSPTFAEDLKTNGKDPIHDSYTNEAT